MKNMEGMADPNGRGAHADETKAHLCTSRMGVKELHILWGLMVWWDTCMHVHTIGDNNYKIDG